MMVAAVSEAFVVAMKSSVPFASSVDTEPSAVVVPVCTPVGDDSIGAVVSTGTGV